MVESLAVVTVADERVTTAETAARIDHRTVGCQFTINQLVPILDRIGVSVDCTIGVRIVVEVESHSLSHPRSRCRRPAQSVLHQGSIAAINHQLCHSLGSGGSFVGGTVGGFHLRPVEGNSRKVFRRVGIASFPGVARHYRGGFLGPLVIIHDLSASRSRAARITIFSVYFRTECVVDVPLFRRTALVPFRINEWRDGLMGFYFGAFRQSLFIGNL